MLFSFFYFSSLTPPSDDSDDAVDIFFSFFQTNIIYLKKKITVSSFLDFSSVSNYFYSATEQEREREREKRERAGSTSATSPALHVYDGAYLDTL